MKKYVLITGATSGIGKEVALRLAKEYNIIFHGRNHENLEILSNDVENSLFWCYDLSLVDGISSSLKALMEKNEIVIEKLVHCAGIDDNLPVKLLNYDSIEKLMKVNFYSVVEIINILLKRSVNKNELKNILFISSISAIRGYKVKAAYSASKAALDAYMKVLSLEVAPNIRVNSILPGAIKTKMTEKSFENEELVKHFVEIYPLGIGKVQQIVDMVEFYLSDKSSWVTGQQIVVDGGSLV
ncbi:short-chain dehydrogenase/reductase [Aliarcobacter faecis]|uniref:SDR family NAD(P)-dependent oxidoreductase n=1 Tax=Aliarcobacter faecis TaxID=1564138 RepID=UPI0004799ACD|nr:SDR family oxidoreductase [Aliarcobacter faecis]QKF73468.1 short-chain dehydrogenase/reductase [Aliarcobacter faecis]